MEPIWHFVVSAGMGLIIVRGWKNSLAWAALCGVIGTLPDMDHFLSAEYAHNLFLLIVAPCLAFVVCFLIDNYRNGMRWAPRISLLFMVILPGHLILDLSAGNAIPLLGPFSQNLYIIRQGTLLWVFGQPVLDYASALLALWAGLTAMCSIAEARLYGSEAKEANDYGEGAQAANS